MGRYRSHGLTGGPVPPDQLPIVPARNELLAGQLALRVRAPAGTKVELTEGIALETLDLIKREAGADNLALTMGLVGVHAPNYPINLIHHWNAGPEEAVLQIQFKPGVVRTEPLKEKLRGVFKSELPDVLVSFEPSDIVERVMSFGAAAPGISTPQITRSAARR